MDLCERNIGKQIFIIRALLFALLISIVYFLKLKRNDYLFVLIVALISCSFIGITNLKITTNEIIITKYLFYGLIPKISLFKKGAGLSISSYDLILHNPGTSSNEDISYLTKPVDVKIFIIKQINSNNIPVHAKLSLSEKELEIIHQYFIKDIGSLD